MAESRFKDVEGDELIIIEPGTEMIQLACCDCGLVHNVFIRLSGAKIILQLQRNDRSTGQLRRYKRGDLQKEAIGGWKMVMD